MDKKNIAIITGANSGIGKEFTKLLSKYSDIDEIWAIARNQDRLNEVRRNCGEKIRIFSMDLTDRANLNAIELLLQTEQPDVRYLVNCAGYAVFCDYGDISKEVSISMIDLNVAATVAMCVMCIPYMSEGSHIVNMSSQASFQPVPFQNIYSATKAFILNYTRALNVELNSRGIRATAVCPGWMNTRLIERASIGAKRGTTKFPHMTEPDVVAEQALADANNDKDISVYSGYIKLSHLLSKLLPEKLVMKVWLMQQDLSESV